MDICPICGQEVSECPHSVENDAPWDSGLDEEQDRDADAERRPPYTSVRAADELPEADFYGE